MDNERLEIDAGATTPPREEAKDATTSYGYTYNWLEFSLEGDLPLSLRIRVYPRVWVEKQTKFLADSTRMSLTNNLYKDFFVQCPLLKKASKPLPDLPKEQVQDPEKTHFSPKNQDVPLMAQQDDAFSRLTLMFWRHLDWRQRIGVLSKLDLLPNTVDQPIPQILEQLALDAAKEQKKLIQLWDEIAQFVPKEVREPNPFRPEN